MSDNDKIRVSECVSVGALLAMASEACNAVYKEGRKVVAQCNRLQTKMEAAVLKASQSRARQGSMEPTASQLAVKLSLAMANSTHLIHLNFAPKMTAV